MPKISAIRRALFCNQNGRCFYCDQPTWIDRPDLFAVAHNITLKAAEQLRATVEHLKARSAGGSNARSNLAAACLYCNSHRHRTPKPLSPDDYKAKVRRRLKANRWHRLRLA